MMLSWHAKSAQMHASGAGDDSSPANHATDFCAEQQLHQCSSFILLTPFFSTVS
jgi:hypothetical protein